MAEVQANQGGSSFLTGSGEMGELIRAHDWSATQLGPMAAWPQSLRTILGTVLASPFPMVIAWGPQLLTLYNEAYRPLLGDKLETLGQPFHQVWAEARETIAPLLHRALAGEGCRFESAPFWLRRRGQPEQAYFDFSFSPVRDESGAIVGVLNTAIEVTAHVLFERRQAFRLSLEHRLRDVTDQAEAVAVVSEALGRYLGVAQVAYAEVEPGGETVMIERDWHDGTMASNRRRHRLDDYGPELIANLRSGETVAIPDVALDRRTSSPGALAAFAQARIVGLLDVPVVKGGQLAAILGVHSHTPRAWSGEEIALAHEIAERTWVAAEQANAQATLRQSEERYRTLFEAIDAGFCIVEVLFEGERAVDYRFLEVNPAFERQTGLIGAAGRRMRELAPGHEQHWFDVYGTVVRTGQPARFENEAAALGRWYDVHAFRISSPAERRVAILFNDISERRRAEQAVRELNDTLERRVAEALAERRLFADIVENTDAFVQVSDLQFRWMAINHAAASEFERIFGTRPKVGDSMLDLLAGKPEHCAAVKAVWSRAFAGEQFTETGEFGEPGRDRRFYEMKYNALRDADGERIGAYQFVYDVTQRIEEQRRLADVEEALRQSQKMETIGSLTGGVAHDFNNLLTPIVGALDLLQRRGLGGEREQRLIAGAAQSAERAKVLVQRLLAFARRQPLQPTAVDVVRLIEGMADLLASTTGPQVRVSVEVAPDLPAAKADPNQLEMALLNLGVNARDAMPDGGTLRISATRETVGVPRGDLKKGDYVRLSVADTGLGMDEATRLRAIEPFFSTKGVGKGTGLGLSMVHGLAAQLGGALTIQSRRGIGTNVELWLPVNLTAVPDVAVPAAKAAPGFARGLALLVDDEEVVRTSTADMLEELGFEVRQADCGEAALALVAGGTRPDLLITDHLMPGMTGVDLARAIQERVPGLPVLIVSGYAEAEGVAPDLPRLNKPFKSVELAASVTALSNAPRDR